MGLWCQPHDHLQEEISVQVIKILTTFDKIDLPSEETTRITIMIDTMTTARSPYQSNQDQSRNWGSNNNYSRSPSMSRQDSSFTDSRNQPRSNSPNPSVFNRFGNQNPSNNISYEKKFPTSNNGNQPNVVRFTTTDDEINGLSGLCPLNYWGLRVPLLTSPRTQDSALIFSTLPPETLKKIVA